MFINLLATVLFTCAVSDTTVTLDDVTVMGNDRRNYQMRSSQTGQLISNDYIETNFSGSLMQTLQGIAGVKAMSIGSGQSKPTIRGLGFNRMVVAEDGIKHEGQQWGDDHGLEIDQFSIDRLEILKGPAALLHGSDAIGGLINIYTNHIPKNKFEGNVKLFGNTNNEQIGFAAKIGGRNKRFFYRANLTLIDYADFGVPTDSIQYYSYFIRLKDQRLRNTAGFERDGGLMLGYAGYHFHTDFHITDSYSKSGFFANAHGLEVRLSDIDYDHSRRDIDLPYQSVNHFKVHSHSSWRNDRLSLELNLAYQNNLREEHSEPVSHGYMPKPKNTLERKFNKSTYTAKLGLRYSLNEKNDLSIGISSEYQDNKRGGWGFIIPDFNTLSLGVYAYDRYTLRDNLIFNYGIRYDFARTNIKEYHDWYKTPASGNDSIFMQRSATIHRVFNSLIWSAGVNYTTGQWLFKANIGKSFRIPIPKELGANGINYHIFRYERGNSQLDPEESYQLDAGINWTNKKVSIQVDPFVNYFPNYIYLNPTADYVEGLQLYHYTQSKVFRWGVEAQMVYSINKHWEAELKGEYLYARQESGEKKGYTLPFSTPFSADATIKYLFNYKGEGYISLNAHVVGRQNEIVPPEKPTAGYFLLNATAGKHFTVAKNTLRITLHVQNLLNKRYYDHTSYYRLIDVPEPGRSISFMLGYDF